MKESYGEILATYTGPESYADDGNIVGVATAGVRLGPDTESRNVHLLVCRPSRAWGRQHQSIEMARSCGHDGIYDLVHERKLQTREPGSPVSLSEEVADSGPKTSPRVPRT
jgi:hypothetical protein